MLFTLPSRGGSVRRAEPLIFFQLRCSSGLATSSSAPSQASMLDACCKLNPTKTKKEAETWFSLLLAVALLRTVPCAESQYLLVQALQERSSCGLQHWAKVSVRSWTNLEVVEGVGLPQNARALLRLLMTRGPRLRVSPIRGDLFM
eukprot:2681887-Amphidinium_carterae.1